MCNHHRSANCVQVSEMQFMVAFIHIEWCLQLNVTKDRTFSFLMFNGELMKIGAIGLGFVCDLQSCYARCTDYHV